MIEQPRWLFLHRTVKRSPLKHLGYKPRALTVYFFLIILRTASLLENTTISRFSYENDSDAYSDRVSRPQRLPHGVNLSPLTGKIHESEHRIVRVLDRIL